LAGRHIRFVEKRLIALRDGDEVVTAGPPSIGNDDFIAHAMQNITQGRCERGWNRWRLLDTFIIIVFGLGSPAGALLSTLDEFGLFIALGYVLTVAVWSIAATALLEQFYVWKLSREALRRVREASKI
jgi:hypothetical protein